MFTCSLPAVMAYLEVDPIKALVWSAIVNRVFRCNNGWHGHRCSSAIKSCLVKDGHPQDCPWRDS
jgi:hypothetical protein